MLRTKQENGEIMRGLFLLLLVLGMLCGLWLAPKVYVRVSNMLETQALEKAAFAPVVRDARLPDVLILGDSISIGYTPVVRAELQGQANVLRPPVNCESSVVMRKHLNTWLGQERWEVIYWNAGLHDLKRVRLESDGEVKAVAVGQGDFWVNVQAYEENIRAIVQQLKQTGAVVIFATTTPVPVGAFGRLPEDVVMYNAVARRVMQEEGVQIDDLYAWVVRDQPNLQKPQDVHLWPAGKEAMGRHVAAVIESQL